MAPLVSPTLDCDKVLMFRLSIEEPEIEESPV